MDTRLKAWMLIPANLEDVTDRNQFLRRFIQHLEFVGFSKDRASAMANEAADYKFNAQEQKKHLMMSPSLVISTSGEISSVRVPPSLEGITDPDKFVCEFSIYLHEGLGVPRFSAIETAVKVAKERFGETK